MFQEYLKVRCRYLRIKLRGSMKNKTIKSVEMPQNAQKGMSFIEIMIVVVIMAGLVAIVGPAMFGKLDDARVKQSKIQMKGLLSGLEMYHLDNFTYPSTEQGLEALMSKPEVGIVPENWRGPYLKSKKVPKDPWGHDYSFQSDGSSISMKSLGADKAEGGDGINADIEPD